MALTFVIPGNPSQRSRHKQYTQGRVWDDYKLEAFNISRLLEDQMGGSEPLSGPLALEFIFFLPRPRGMAVKPNSYSISKPNVDNMMRMYLNCFEGIVFSGSQHVASLKASKLYDSTARTEIIVTKI